MKIYLLSQSKNNDYDTYDAVVVTAESEDEARQIHPTGVENWIKIESNEAVRGATWVMLADVKVKYIGTAKRGAKSGVILSSFNAG